MSSSLRMIKSRISIVLLEDVSACFDEKEDQAFGGPNDLILHPPGEICLIDIALHDYVTLHLWLPISKLQFAGRLLLV
jgi:hypothetical protein